MYSVDDSLLVCKIALRQILGNLYGRSLVAPVAVDSNILCIGSTITVGSTPIVMVNEKAILLLCTLNRSPQFRELKQEIKEYAAKYLPDIEVKEGDYAYI